MVTDAAATSPRWMALTLTILVLGSIESADAASGIVVFQSDFGLEDQAVAAMRGVARSVDVALVLENLTHEIPPFDIWQAAYRLDAVIDYWPEGTVFVSVVDPGVGTARRSIVMRTGSGHYVVSPDNGTLTLVADRLGIAEVREIDESINRLPGSRTSHTFHGRDVYAYTGARLASRQIAFEQVGPKLETSVVRIDYRPARIIDEQLEGTIDVLDPQYGNVWTNIPRAVAQAWRLALNESLSLSIFHGEREVLSIELPFVETFGDVPKGSALLYFNSLDRLAVALNQGNFAGQYRIGSGADWRVSIARPEE